MKSFFGWICFILLNKLRAGYSFYVKGKLGYCGKNVNLSFPSELMRPQNIFLYDNTNILGYFKFISYTGKFIMKKNSGAAQGLTVITGNHHRSSGVFFKESLKNRTNDIEKDVVVEEDVWIGANVTLLSGVKIGRGATIGAGSVCIKSVPPYAIAMGNPAKVVGFNFNPEEIIEHEKALYPEDERLPIEVLEKYYNRYYINRISEIKNFLKQ